VPEASYSTYAFPVPLEADPLAGHTSAVSAPSTLDKLVSHFPFPEIRPQQHIALKTIADSFDRGIPFTLLECPTGAGKSPVAIAAAAHVGSAHYVTSQNILSDQIVNDFGHLGIDRIKGKANYECRSHANCAIGTQVNGSFCAECPYRIAKEAYMRSAIGTTNYSYILTEAMYAKELLPRKLLVLDEAHNIESEILSLTDIEIAPATIKHLNLSRVPYFRVNEESMIRQWLNKTFMVQLEHRLETLKARPSSSLTKLELAEVSTLNKLKSNITLYLESDRPEDWLAWSQDDKLLIRPLDCSSFARDFLFAGAEHILMMSATILDHSTFARTLGIPRDKINSLSLPSDFDPKNRRIVFWPTGSMSYATKMATLPRMAQRTSAILDRFSAVKGVVHTHTYQINDYLVERLSTGEHSSRIITHTGAPGSREAALQQHFLSPEPTVLFSPSMAEGVDLVDDLSRFQIIVKVPYPLLDTYNRARMERDPKWYALKTAVKLTQSTGRSVRNHNDYAWTGILDSDFYQFLLSNTDILPPWWRESVEFRDAKSLC